MSIISKICAHCGGSFEGFHSRRYCDDCFPPADEGAKHRFYTYKLTNKRYLEMKAALNDGLCPICELWEADAVDHDHNCCGSPRPGTKNRTRYGCGKCVRGLVCSGCNLMMQKYDEGKVIRLPKTAREYLARHALPRGSAPPQ